MAARSRSSPAEPLYSGCSTWRRKTRCVSQFFQIRRSNYATCLANIGSRLTNSPAQVNRMQASATASFPPARTSTAQGQESSHRRQHLELRPTPLKPTGRAMTTPALSVAIPPPKVSFSGTTTKYIIRSDGDAVPQEEETEDSDVSSICHSPGWEDSASKKRRKEKAEARERKKK